MSNQRCNSDLREPQIVRKACEAVSQDMRGNTIKGRTLENPVPLMRERAKDWAVSQAGEDIIRVGLGMALFEIFQYGQPHRRSEEGRVGKECESTGRSRWSP